MIEKIEQLILLTVLADCGLYKLLWPPSPATSPLLGLFVLIGVSVAVLSNKFVTPHFVLFSLPFFALPIWLKDLISSTYGLFCLKS